MLVLLQDILSYISIFLGVVFLLIAGIGIIRLPDFYIRMSAITKAGTMGVGFIVLGISIHFNDLTIAGKSFVIVSFMLLTSPVAAHIISRAAYRQDVPFWKKNLFDQLSDRIKKLKETEDAVSENPSDISLKWDLIDLYTSIPSIMGGSSRKAIITASDIKDLDPAEGHLASGTVYMKDREFSPAEEEFLQAVEVSGRSARSLVELGKFYRFIEKPEKALACFEEVIGRSEGETTALLEYGKTSAQFMIELEKGIEILKRLLNKEEKPALLADAAYYSGMICQLLKKPGEAKQYFNKALEYRSSHALAQNALRGLK